MSNFPNVLAVVEAREKHLETTEGKDLWALADALIKDCGDEVAKKGRPAFSDTNRGLIDKLTQCAAMLEKHGYAGYQASTLQQLRQAGLIFPKARRYPDFSFWVHKEAGSPDFMDWVVKKHGVKKGNITIGKIRELVRAAQEIERKERDKKVAVAQVRLKKATSVAEARQAKAEIAENKGPPRAINLPSPDTRPDHPLHAVAALLDISLHISGATKTLRKDLAIINNMDGVDPDHGEEMIQECDALIAVTTQLRNAIRGEKEKGLTVIGGKK